MVNPAAPPSTRVVEDEVKEQFLAWAASEPGIELSPDVEMFHIFREGYRGVLALKDIAAGTALVRVARSCCIGPETTDASQRAWREAMDYADTVGAPTGDGKSAGPRLTRACFTVLRLLHERGLGKKSPFHAYLNVLPREHRLPMEWNQAELKMLEGTSAEPLIGVASLDSQYEAFKRVVELHPEMWKTSVCTKAAFAKGVNWVRSRGFAAFGDPQMIPGADMFNHDPDRQSAQIGTDGDDHFVMRTVHPVKAGDEVFFSFGHLSNAQLLNSYGFVLPGNSFDTVLVPTKLVTDTCYATFLKLEAGNLEESEAKSAWETRLAMVASNANEGEQEAFVISKYDLLPEGLADMVQILTMSNDEEVAFAAIANVAQAKMRQYNTLASCDGEAAAGGTEGADDSHADVGEDARALAKMLVTEEKKVLRDLKIQLMSEAGEHEHDDEEEDSASDAFDATDSRGRPRGSRSKKGKRRKRR